MEQAGWTRDAIRSRSVTTAMYSRLPEGARLWTAGAELVPNDRIRIAAALR